MDRFWSKVTKTDGCWEWTGSRHTQGYGQFRFGGKSSKAHRVSWFLATGEMPPASVKVCHRCDNPPCVRPDHLFLGSQRENMADCSAKGRMGDHIGRAAGERNGMAVLSPVVVMAARLMRQGGTRPSVIADRLGISRNNVSKITLGRTWKHL